MVAANRAVTAAARERRLQLVDLYVQRLEALHEPNPFDDPDFLHDHPNAATDLRPAVRWPGSASH